MKRSKTKSRFYYTRPRRRQDGRYEVHFYSRHPWPFFSAVASVEKPADVLPAFKRFIESAKEHSKRSHTDCDCCYHPGKKCETRGQDRAMIEGQKYNQKSTT